MFKDLNYYKELSEQLGKEIEICESSYENFEKAISSRKKDEPLTEEQQRIVKEFSTFCKEEGFSKDGRVVSATYPEIKEKIVERVKFLKDQKEINDKMLSLHTELDKLKNKGELDASEVEIIKKDTEKHYDVGTEKYVREFERNKRKVVAEKIKNVNDEIGTQKEKEKNFQKENGIAKVVSSAFGPAGNVIYNAYAKVHNLNVDLRKKKVLNLVVKAGLSLGLLGVVYVAGITGWLLPVGIGVGFAPVIIGIKETISKNVPEKLKLTETVLNLKENWFRFKKSRGLGEKLLTNDLYKGIDFSKYESKVEPAVVENDANEKEFEEVKEPTKIEEKEIEKEVNPVENPIVEPVAVETPETPIEVSKKEPVEVEDKKDKSEENTVVTPVVESIKEHNEMNEEIVEEDFNDDKEENKLDKKDTRDNKNLKYKKEDVERLKLLRDTIKLPRSMNIGNKCESLDDVKKALYNFSRILEKYDNNSLFGGHIDDSTTLFTGKSNGVSEITTEFFSLLRAKEFIEKKELTRKSNSEIYNQCNEMIFNMPKEIVEYINRELNYLNINKNQVKTMTENSRNEAFNEIISLINDESKLDENIFGEINRISYGFSFDSQQWKDINNALKEREEYIRNRRRGK